MVSEPVVKTIWYRKSLGSSLGKLNLLYFPLAHYVTLEQKCNLDQSWSISPMKAGKHLIKNLPNKEFLFSCFMKFVISKNQKPPSRKIEIYVHCTHLFWAWIMTSGAWTLPRMSILHIFRFFLTICLTCVSGFQMHRMAWSLYLYEVERPIDLWRSIWLVSCQNIPHSPSLLRPGF